MRYTCLLVSTLASVAAGCATPPSSVQFHDWSPQSIVEAYEQRITVTQESRPKLDIGSDQTFGVFE